MKALLVRFVGEDSGQDLIEYGILVGLITAITVGAVTAIGTTVQGFYTSLCTAIGAAC